MQNVDTQAQSNNDDNVLLRHVNLEPEPQLSENDAEATTNAKRDGSATNTGQIYIPPKDEGKMFVEV